MAKRPNAVKTKRSGTERKRKPVRDRRAGGNGRGSARVLPLVLSAAMLICIGAIGDKVLHTGQSKALACSIRPRCNVEVVESGIAISQSQGQSYLAGHNLFDKFGRAGPEQRGDKDDIG